MSTAKDLTDVLNTRPPADDPYATRVVVSTPPGAETALEDAKQRLPTLRTDVARAEYEAARDGTIRPVPVPWENLETRLAGRGLWPRSCTILVGGTGSGKTQWCVQLAVHAAQQGTPVLYVALEADEPELVARCHSVLNPHLYWSHVITGTQMPAPEADAALKALPFHAVFPEPRRFTNHTLTELVRGMFLLYPGSTPFVVVDFLQLVGSDGTGKDLRERVSDVAYGARDLARQTGCAMLLVSSTARENLGRVTNTEKGEKLGQGDPYRLVALGKETGDIENSATTVLVLGRENFTPGAPSSMWLAVAKQRKGVPAWVRFMFDGRTFTASTEQLLNDATPVVEHTIPRRGRRTKR